VGADGQPAREVHRGRCPATSHTSADPARGRERGSVDRRCCLRAVGCRALLLDSALEKPWASSSSSRARHERGCRKPRLL
jgi:hypothetical protein